jgi:hypothetical protein
MGECGDCPVADQAAQPVTAGHLGRPGQQPVCRGMVVKALAAEGENDQVKRATA